MGALRGAVMGGIGLSAMYLVVTSNGKALQDATGLPGKALHWLIDPNVPAIPNLHDGGNDPLAPSYAAAAGLILNGVNQGGLSAQAGQNPVPNTDGGGLPPPGYDPHSGQDPQHPGSIPS